MRLIYLFFAVSLLFSIQLLSAQVTNLGTVDVGGNDFYSSFKATIGDKLFFVAPADRRSGEFGNTIWVSDGTTSGTKALNNKIITLRPVEQKDSLIFYSAYNNINNGSIDLWQLNGQTLQQTKFFTGYEISNLMFKDELIYFTGRDSLSPTTHLYNLNLNTRRLTKIAPSPIQLPINYEPNKSYAVNDSILLYFAYKSNNTQFSNYELWRTNGTSQGTYRIEDTSRSYLRNLFSFKGKFYFNKSEAIYNGQPSYTCWVTDGASKPTKLPYNLDFSTGVFTDKGFIGVGRDSIHGVDLWFSDLSSNAAQNIGDLDSTRYSIFKDNRYVLEKAGAYPYGFTKFNDKAYFFSTNDSCSLAFYETDGSRAGTKLIKSLVKKAEAAYQEKARTIFQVNGKIYAEVLTPQYGNEIFVSDGTSEGTKILDIWKGAGNSNYWESLRSIGFTDKNAYFVANNGISGNQVWQANGTNDAFKRISNNPITRGWVNTFVIGSINNQLLFTTKQDTIISFWRFDEDKPTALQEESKRQNYKWLTSFGTIGFASGTNDVLSLSTDNRQNTFILGRSSYNTFAFFDTTQLVVKNKRNIGSYYDGNTFIAKYDSLGKLKWSKDLFSTSTLFSNNKKNMTIDEEGNTYIIAQSSQEFFGLVRNIYVDSTLIHTTGSGIASFILKFNPDGQLLWFKRAFKNFSTVNFLDIVAKGKHIYVTGISNTNFTFNSLTLPSGLFALKLDETGKGEWATKLDDKNSAIAINMTVDNLGNLIVLDDKGNVSKVKNDNGAMAWSKKLPLSTDSKMTIQNDGSVFFLTDFTGSISFDSKNVTTSKSTGLVLVGLDADGDVIQVKVISQDALLTPLVLTSDGNGVFKAVYYRVKEGATTLKFPSWRISNRSSIVARQFTATGLEMAQREIFVGLEQRGTFKADFDNQDDFVFSGKNIEYIDTIPNIPLSYRDFNVLARFSLRGKLVKPKDDILKLGDVSLSPNPASNVLTLSSEDGDFRDANILIYNILGQFQSIVTAHSDAGLKSINITHLIKGIYILVIQRGNEILTKKFTKF